MKAKVIKKAKVASGPAVYVANGAIPVVACNINESINLRARGYVPLPKSYTKVLFKGICYALERNGYKAFINRCKIVDIVAKSGVSFDYLIGVAEFSQYCHNEFEALEFISHKCKCDVRDAKFIFEWYISK